MSLVGGGAIPVSGFGTVLLDINSVLIEMADVILREDLASFCFLEPHLKILGTRVWNNDLLVHCALLGLSENKVFNRRNSCFGTIPAVGLTERPKRPGSESCDIWP